MRYAESNCLYADSHCKKVYNPCVRSVTLEVNGGHDQTQRRDVSAPVKAAVHWVRVSAFSAKSSPNLAWAAMGLRADSARRLSVRADPLTR